MKFCGFKMFAFTYLFSEGKINAISPLKIEYHTFKLHSLSQEPLCSYAMKLLSEILTSTKFDLGNQTAMMVARYNDTSARLP